MKETMHFRYKSPENLVRLLCEVVYEQSHSPRDISIYHERFCGEDDDFFAKMLLSLFPNGATIGEEEVNKCVCWLDDFLKTDERAMDIRVKYDMAECESYVYFDIDKKVVPCRYASHQKTIKDICVDYFKGFDKESLTLEQVRKFILEHFQIKSSFSTIQTIANDAGYIYECVIFDHAIKERRAT